MAQNIYLKICPLLCANTYHDVTDLHIHGMVRTYKKLNISRMEHDIL